MRQGVQGGSPIFHHTSRMFKKQGFEATPCELQVSFGKGPTFFTNLFPTPLIQRHGKEIKKFMRVLKIVHWLRPIFALLSIRATMRLCAPSIIAYMQLTDSVQILFLKRFRQLSHPPHDRTLSGYRERNTPRTYRCRRSPAQRPNRRNV